MNVNYGFNEWPNQNSGFFQKMSVMVRRPKILIVDDESDARLFLADILAAQGYTTILTPYGREALTLINQEPPDLVLLDIRLPDINGVEVCRRIRQQPTTASLPIILVTALNPYQERPKGIEAGADEFLTKPINKVELLERVRALLRTEERNGRTQAHRVPRTE